MIIHFFDSNKLHKILRAFLRQTEVNAISFIPTNQATMVKDSILTAAGAALGLFALAFTDENVLSKVDNINCVAAPLVATAVMIFSSKKAADAKSIIG